MKYKDEYKLAEGFPVIEMQGPFKQIHLLLNKLTHFRDYSQIDYPEDFRKVSSDTPKYELILRRLDRVKRKRRKRQTKKKEDWY